MYVSRKSRQSLMKLSYDEQVGMMEMVLDVDDIVSEMTSIREQYCAFKD